MAKRVKVNPELPDPKIIEFAVSIFKGGGTIVYPTDTLYGLGADALNADAVKKIFEIKGRSYSQPLSVLVEDVDMLERFADDVPDIARKLAKKFWSGALTIIVWAKKLKYLGSEKIGFRSPAHNVPLEIIKIMDGPIVGTSANISQFSGAHDPAEIERQIGGHVDLMLDCGKLAESRPSTVIDVTEHLPKLVRVGAIEVEEIERFIKVRLRRDDKR